MNQPTADCLVCGEAPAIDRSSIQSAHHGPFLNGDILKKFIGRLLGYDHHHKEKPHGAPQ